MSTIMGIPFLWTAKKPDSFPIGRYATREPFEGRQHTVTTIECPYCHALLNHAITFSGGRIVALLPNVVPFDGHEWKVLVDPLPATHDMLRCDNCEARFTTLKADAVGQTPENPT